MAITPAEHKTAPMPQSPFHNDPPMRFDRNTGKSRGLTSPANVIAPRETLDQQPPVLVL